MYDDITIAKGNLKQQIAFVFPGLISSCSPMASALLSTLECFYSDFNCTRLLAKYMFRNATDPSFGENMKIPQPLIYVPTEDRYYPNTPIKEIVKNLMIERWNVSLEYDLFYQSCLPSYCVYLQKRRNRTLLEVMVTLISMIGGLTLSLRLLTPMLVKCVSRLAEWMRRKKEQRSSEGGEYDRSQRFISRIFLRGFSSTI